MKAVLIITPKHLNRGLQRDFRDQVHGKEIDGITYSVAPFLGIAKSGTSITINIESQEDLFGCNEEFELSTISSILGDTVEFSKEKLYCYSKCCTIKSTLVITEE